MKKFQKLINEMAMEMAENWNILRGITLDHKVFNDENEIVREVDTNLGIPVKIKYTSKKRRKS
jgi:hypothetical protein